MATLEQANPSKDTCRRKIIDLLSTCREYQIEKDSPEESKAYHLLRWAANEDWADLVYLFIWRLRRRILSGLKGEIDSYCSPRTYDLLSEYGIRARGEWDALNAARRCGFHQ